MILASYNTPSGKTLQFLTLSHRKVFEQVKDLAICDRATAERFSCPSQTEVFLLRFVNWGWCLQENLQFLLCSVWHNRNFLR